MSYKEDLFRMLDGKTPVSDVAYYLFEPPPGFEGNGVVMLGSSYSGFGPGPDGKNDWGVPLKLDVFGIGFMPEPGQIILPDITKWRDVIKAPYRYDFDFAAAAEQDMARLDYDPETQVVTMFGGGGGYFLQLVSFMGFEGAMLAMYDEPEAVHELLDYLCDYDCWLVENYLKHYTKADIMGMGDDTATELNPFMSLEFFREFLLPRYKRVADKIREYGKIVSYHNCGRCEDYMDDMVDIGVQIWNAATTKNDLNAFKAKHGNRIVMDVNPRFDPYAPEEGVRQKVRDVIDTYAPNGAFVWIGGSTIPTTELGKRVDAWILDEVLSYGKGFYA